jgi:endonuclease YncB( thermonuclease family)
MRLLACCALAALLGFLPKDAAAIDTCSGGNRAARKVTRIVDGDTIWQAGVKMRLLDIDTPETYRRNATVSEL